MNKNHFFEVCARGIFLAPAGLLVCKNVDKDYFYFPGGHVEFGEKAEVALRRELQEEIGAKIGKARYIGTVENIFRQNGADHHELNIVFFARIKNIKTQSREGHLTFEFVPLKNLKKEKIYPTALKNSITKYLADKKIFWRSQLT